MRRVLPILLAVTAACSSTVAPTNPYDPATPAEQQARATLRGALALGGAASSAGVTVWIRQNGKLLRNVTTALGGDFVFGDLVPGAYAMEASPAGFAPVAVAVTVRAGEDLDLGTIDVSPLAASSALEGVATLAGVGALENAGTLVEVVGRAYTAVTGSDGQFRLDLPPGEYDLRFSHASFVTVSYAQPVTVASGETRTLDPVVLPTNPATLIGHVDAEVAGGGTGPLGDATVTLIGTSVTGLTFSAPAALGDFTLTGIPAGSYVVRVVKPGYVGADVPVLNLAGGELRALPEPVVLALARGGVAGAVSLGDSTDASGIVVEVSGTSSAVVTASDGAYAFPGLLAGTYALSARRDGYARKDLGTWTVVAGEVTHVTPATLSRQGGSVVVLEGSYVSARGVHLVATASGVGWYKASEDPAFGDAPTWTVLPGNGQLPVTLADADGEHTVWVEFSADQSTATTPASAVVVLDRQKPGTPALVIGGGGGYTSAVGGVVSLSLSAQDLPPTPGAAVSGLAKMELSNDGFVTFTSLDYALATTWALASPSTDGPKAVSARFRDRAGNVSDPVAATVALDTVRPASPSIVLSGPAPSPAGVTTTPFVSAALGASDANGGPSNVNLLVRLSNTPGFEGARYQPFASAVTWLLPPGDGAKTVYAQFMDPAGNESLPVSGAIALDTSGPTGPTVTLAERDTRPANGFTRVLTVDLALSAGGSPTAAQISEDPSFTNGVKVASMAGLPQPVTTAFTFGGAGLRTAWVRFLDAAGNASLPAAASVTVDATAPSAVAPAISPSGVTTATAVQLVPPSAGQDEVQLGGNVVAPTGWVSAPAGVAIPVTLTGGDGPKTVTATWRDLADNTTVAPAVSVALDATAPTAVGFTVSGTLGDGAASNSLTASTGVTLNFSAVASDGATGTGVTEMQVSNQPSLADAAWVPVIGSSALPWTLPPGDGPKVVYARFRDAARNPSAVVQGTITLGATPPSGGTVSIEGGAAATSKPSASLAVSAVGAVEMQVLVNGVAAGPWTAYATAGAAPMADPEGTKLVAVKFRNAARVEGGSASSAILYDHTPPPAPVVTVRGTLGNGAISTTYSTTNAVLVDVAGTGDAGEMALVQSATCTFPPSPTWLPLTASSSFLLSGGDGAKTVCVKLRDRAANVGAAGQGTIALDTAAPSNPAFSDLTTLVTSQPTVTGTLVAASVDPAPGSGVVYQCYASPASPSWTDCALAAGNKLTFALAGNGPNVVGVRARDGAFNASTGTLVSVLQDGVKPFPPNITQVRTSRDSLTLTWDPSADTDLASFLVYYGNAAGDIRGTGAAQGPSPIQVSAVGAATQSFTLTGLAAGVPYYVAVEAVDRAGNRSGLSGQRFAVPNVVNPRALSSIGGQPRGLVTLTDAGSGRTFAYLAQNQGVVQLDVTNDAATPPAVGRAYVPNVVPDRGAQPAVIPCTSTAGGAATAGHCVILAGTTLEGDFRGDAAFYRAPPPVVFFPVTGTAAAPALGRVETVLPALPHRVVTASVGGQTVVLAVEGRRLVAFDLAKIAFPRQLAEVSFPATLSSVLAATAVGTDFWAYGPQRSGGYVYPPRLQYVDLTDVLYGDLYATDAGSLTDLDGNTLGGGGPNDPAPVPAFHGGVYVAYTDGLGAGHMCGYDGFAPTPESCASFAMDGASDGGALLGATGGNGHLYAFVQWGLGSGPYAYQLDVAGTTVTSGGSVAAAPGMNITLSGARVGVYATSPATTAEHLLSIDLDGASLDYQVQRWRVNGATVTYSGSPYREIKPTWFAESDRLVYASQGPTINVIDASNPLVPRVVSSVTRSDNTYGKLVVHGRTLYAVTTNYVSGHGVEIFRVSGDGTVTYQSRIATTQVPNDLVAMGKWLFVARSAAAGLAAWNVANPAAPVAAGSVATPAYVYGLDARPATSGSAWAAVLYTAQGATAPANGAFQTYGYSAAGTFTALSGVVTLPGRQPHAVRVRGATAAVADLYGTTTLSVGSPASPSVAVAALPVSGPAQFQGGYLVGLAPSGAPSGPVFDVYTGSSSSSGAVDGALLYSTCADDGAAGSLAFSQGLYLASCRGNGITLFTVGDQSGGRLLKRFDVADTWMGDSAAFATDGVTSVMGGAFYQSDPSRLWSVSELGNAWLVPNGPAWATNVVAPGSSPYARWMLVNDGLAWSFNGAYLGNSEGMEAYETANGSLGSARASVTLTGNDVVSAQPVTDGEYLYLPRSSRFGGSWSRIDVYDIRDPAAVTATPLAGGASTVAFGERLEALALARDRLYVGRQTGYVQVYGVSGATLTARTGFSLGGGAGAVTGIAASGRYLFVTAAGALPGSSSLTVIRMDPSSRDGAGATVVGALQASLPLANPVVAGDTLYCSNNLGVASFDLAPLWERGAMPVALGGTVNVDATRAGPVRFVLDGPFGYLVGGTYRAFDLR